MRSMVPIPGTSQVAVRPPGGTDWQVVDVGPVADEITRLRARVEELERRAEPLLREILDWFTDRSRAYDRCKACGCTWWARSSRAEMERHNFGCFVPRLRALTDQERDDG